MNATLHRCPSRGRLSRSLLSAASIAAVASVLTITICTTPSFAATPDETTLQRLATCRDSWLEWQDGHPRGAQYVEFVQTRLQPSGEPAGFTPKDRMTLAGLPVEEVYPQSVGMGVGVSAIVQADYATARRAFEKELGKPMTCATSDGSPSCELKIGAKKTAVLLSEGARGGRTLIGCFYLYQQ